MEFTTRAATPADLEALLAIELDSTPGMLYMEDNRDFYFGDENKGEMVLAITEDGEPVGMGQYSVLPDGAGWLEILRVKKAWQSMGAGKAIYKRYLQLAQETNAPNVAMYTGRTNAASKGLAEINGFTLAAAYNEFTLPTATAPEKPAGFEVVKDAQKIAEILDVCKPTWGPFMVFNRTFMNYGMPLCEYLAARGMVYTDGVNSVVLGARMLEARGWFIAAYTGDAATCLAFAAAATCEKGLPKVNLTVPAENADVAAAAQAAGFTPVGEIIVMQKHYR